MGVENPNNEPPIKPSQSGNAREYVPGFNLRSIPDNTLKALEDNGVKIKLTPNGGAQLVPPNGYLCDVNGRLSPSVQLNNNLESINVTRSAAGLLSLALNGGRERITFFTPIGRISDMHQAILGNIQGAGYQSEVSVNKIGEPVIKIRVPPGRYVTNDSVNNTTKIQQTGNGSLEIDAYTNVNKIGLGINGVVTVSTNDMRTGQMNTWESDRRPMGFDTREPGRTVPDTIADNRDRLWMENNFNAIATQWNSLFGDQKMRFINTFILPQIDMLGGKIIDVYPSGNQDGPSLTVVSSAKNDPMNQKPIRHVITRNTLHNFTR